jgi:hypothetical protein
VLEPQPARNPGAGEPLREVGERLVGKREVGQAGLADVEQALG